MKEAHTRRGVAARSPASLTMARLPSAAVCTAAGVWGPIGKGRPSICTVTGASAHTRRAVKGRGAPVSSTTVRWVW